MPAAPWDWLTGVTGFLNIRRCRKHLSEMSCLCRNLTGGGPRDGPVLHVENETRRVHTTCMRIDGPLDLGQAVPPSTEVWPQSRARLTVEAGRGKGGLPCLLGLRGLAVDRCVSRMCPVSVQCREEGKKSILTGMIWLEHGGNFLLF